MTRSRGPRLLALTAGAVLFCLAVTEAAGYGLFWLKHRQWPVQAAQAFYTPEHHYMTDHPYLPYLALPGRHGGMDFNSLGDRGPEPDRPKKRIRLLCFGGSTTFDMAHTLELTWPGMLQTRLGPRYEVINAAQNGATTADTVAAVRELTGGFGADVVIDAVGRPETWRQAFYARDLAGTVVLVGVPTPDMRLEMPLIDFFSRGGSLKSSWYGDCLPERDFPMLIDLYLQGRLPLERFVSERIALEDVEQAFHTMHEGKVLRSVVVL
jgi:hypothetical protein